MEAMIEQLTHMARQQARIESLEFSVCGVIDALQRGDMKAALKIGTEALLNPETSGNQEGTLPKLQPAGCEVHATAGSLKRIGPDIPGGKSPTMPEVRGLAAARNAGK
jgi:hypothetical protein